MAGTTVRITKETHAFLREMVDQAHEPMQEILARAVAAYRR